jgi:hypothetical protein
MKNKSTTTPRSKLPENNFKEQKEKHDTFQSDKEKQVLKTNNSKPKTNGTK